MFVDMLDVTERLHQSHAVCVCVCVCRMDKLHMALTELCFAINYCSVITVWEHGFVPRDFFTQHLELRFNKCCHLASCLAVVMSVQRCNIPVGTTGNCDR